METPHIHLIIYIPVLYMHIFEIYIPVILIITFFSSSSSGTITASALQMNHTTTASQRHMMLPSNNAQMPIHIAPAITNNHQPQSTHNSQLMLGKWKPALIFEKYCTFNSLYICGACDKTAPMSEMSKLS